MSFLTIIAAKKGVAAIAPYHDPAGILITLACTAGLWGLAMLFNNKLKPEARIPETGSRTGGLEEKKAESESQRSAVNDQRSEARGQGPRTSTSDQDVKERCSLKTTYSKGLGKTHFAS